MFSEKKSTAVFMVPSVRAVGVRARSISHGGHFSWPDDGRFFVQQEYTA